MRGDRKALELIRREALVAGRAQPLIAVLARLDPRWTARHAEEIVRVSPDAAAPLLIILSGVDVAALG